MARITTEKLRRAGFLLTDCSDGKFWVIEKEPGAEADRIAALCRMYLEDMDSSPVSEIIVLQCGEDFGEPALYVDGFLWNLSRRDFSGILSRLARHGAQAARKVQKKSGDVSGT